jgi:hypothetical protein
MWSGAWNRSHIDGFFSFRLSDVYGEVPWLGRLGTVAMGDLIVVLSIFAVGAGCGYYARDLISKRRRERYLKSKQLKRARNSIVSYLPRKGRRAF